MLKPDEIPRLRKEIAIKLFRSGRIENKEASSTHDRSASECIIVNKDNRDDIEK